MQNRMGITRRELLVASMGMAAACSLPAAATGRRFVSTDSVVCNTMPEQTVGPYYIANELLRSDIREGRPGLPLSLRLLVLDSRTCRPLADAAVDVWHCDALGQYAGFTKMSMGGPGQGAPGPPPPGPPPGFDPRHSGNRGGLPEGMGPPPAMKPSDEHTFLRGIQFTDAKGRVAFATVLPGFYMGRTNHIHFKVREGGRVVGRGAGDGKTYVEGHTSHIGQVFFPEGQMASLMKLEPYVSHQVHRTTLAEDDIFQDQHGRESTARLELLDSQHPEAGYVAELIVAVNPSITPPQTGMGGPPR